MVGVVDGSTHGNGLAADGVVPGFCDHSHSARLEHRSHGAVDDVGLNQQLCRVDGSTGAASVEQADERRGRPGRLLLAFGDEEGNGYVNGTVSKVV